MPHSASADHVETATRGIGGMAELSDGDGALAYGDSILVGERVRLRGLRDDDLPSLARLEMDPGVMVTLANSVAPPSEAAAKERIATWCANDKGDLGFAIETIDDPPILVGRIQLAVAPYNAAGIRAYEKAGFVEEGRRRDAVWHDGRWYDEVMMSVIDSEWAAHRSPS